jgi:tetratricopeptide (TPR) repeat protein
VLAALGYRSGQPRRLNIGVILGLILFAAALAAWSWRPTAAPSNPAPIRATGPTHTEPAPPKPNAPTTPAPKPAQPTAALPTVRSEGLARATESKPATSVPAPTRSPSTPTTVAKAPAAKADDFTLALYYQRTGDFELALVHYKTVLQRDEMNANAHNNVGNLYMSKALYEDAAREFRRVVAIEPKYVTARVNLSAALYQLKRYDESAAEARAALRLDARNADAYVNLGLAQAAEGQPSDARASLVRALEIDKHHAAAHYNLALQYEKAGELALALDHYRSFLQYAGPEQAGYAADVRARVQALERKSGT